MPLIGSPPCRTSPARSAAAPRRRTGRADRRLGRAALCRAVPEAQGRPRADDRRGRDGQVLCRRGHGTARACPTARTCRLMRPTPSHPYAGTPVRRYASTAAVPADGPCAATPPAMSARPQPCPRASRTESRPRPDRGVRSRILARQRPRPAAAKTGSGQDRQRPRPAAAKTGSGRDRGAVRTAAAVVDVTARRTAGGPRRVPPPGDRRTAPVGTRRPGVGTCGGHRPAARSPQPAARSRQAAARSPQPEVRSPCPPPGALSSKSAGRARRPERPRYGPGGVRGPWSSSGWHAGRESPQGCRTDGAPVRTRGAARPARSVSRCTARRAPPSRPSPSAGCPAAGGTPPLR